MVSIYARHLAWHSSGKYSEWQLQAPTMTPIRKSDNVERTRILLPEHYCGESVDLYVNSSCNLKCKTCFLGDNYFATRNDISIVDAKNILTWASRAGVRDAAFLGGEPSLHPHIEDLLRIARDAGILRSRFITNGTRPFQKLIASAAREYISIVHVSLDGASADSNDAIRGRGAYNQAIKTMSILRKHQIPFVITASITPESLGEIASLLALAEESGCCTINIHWVSPTGRAVNGACSISSDAWLAVCRLLMDYKPKRRSLKIQCQPAYWTEDLQALGTTLRRDACAVRERTNLQFMPNGSVYACGLLTDRPGLNAYAWTGDIIVERQGRTELTICQQSGRPGCPVRRDLVREPDSDLEPVPLCIYQRLNNAEN